MLTPDDIKYLLVSGYTNKDIDKIKTKIKNITISSIKHLSVERKEVSVKVYEEVVGRKRMILDIAKTIFNKSCFHYNELESYLLELNKD